MSQRSSEIRARKKDTKRKYEMMTITENSREDLVSTSKSREIKQRKSMKSQKSQKSTKK